jgi:hypothetical protein
MTLQPYYKENDHIDGTYLVRQVFMGGIEGIYFCLDLKTSISYVIKAFQL